MKNDWLSDKPFAHRGLHDSVTGSVENSLSAFLAANGQGHGFELDVQLSKDGKAMVFHELSLTRLTGQSGEIQDFTAVQLSKFKLGPSDDVIPTLAVVLAKADPELPILIEIKGDQVRYDDIAQAVYQDISDYSGPVAIMSFTPEIILWFQKHAPQIHRGLVATPIKAVDKDNHLPDSYFSIPKQKLLIDQLGVDFIAYDINALPNEVTEYCRGQKIPVLTWTVRTDEQKQKAQQYTDNIIYEIND